MIVVYKASHVPEATPHLRGGKRSDGRPVSNLLGVNPHVQILFLCMQGHLMPRWRGRWRLLYRMSDE